MPELRKDPVIGRWVIVATERAQRPHDFHVPKDEPKGGFCPFCEGNEKKTPAEVYSIRRPGTGPDEPGWQVRVVPNEFPVLRIEGDEAFLAGLIHDIGLVVELQAENSSILDIVQRTKAGISFTQAEEAVLGANHQEISMPRSLPIKK